MIFEIEKYPSWIFKLGSHDEIVIFVPDDITGVTWLMYACLIMSDMLMYSLEVTWSCVHAIRLECNKRFEHETTGTGRGEEYMFSNQTKF